MTKKRHSTSSHIFLLDTYRKAGKLVEIPAVVPEMTVHQQAVFQLFCSGKAPSDWLEHELVHVAQLAVLTVKHQEVMQQLEDEGVVIINARGTPIQNPLFSVADSLLRMSLALSRSLGLASVSSADKKTTTKRALSAQEAKGAQKGKKTNKVSLLAKTNKN